MMRVENLLIIGTLLLGLSIISSAGADEKTTGKELIDKANKVSNIRAQGAPAFRMEGTFRIPAKKDGKEIDGRYTEVWISKGQWRREVETSSFHRVEIGAPAKKWVADTGTDRPDAALSGTLTLVFPREMPEVHKVSRRELGGTQAVCLELATELWSKAMDCVDPSTGVFLVQEKVFSPPNNLPAVHHSCVYRNYEPFGDRLFPRSIHCRNEPGDDVDLTISKLVIEEPTVDQSLFSQPPRAIEERICEGHTSAPRAILSPDPPYPSHHEGSATVTLVITVGEDGKPHNAQIARSGGKGFDQSALNTIPKWTFRPATCDGVPYPVQVNVEMRFSKF